MISNCYYARYSDPLLYVDIHEGDVIYPLLFSFRDKPDEWYRPELVPVGEHQCDGCDVNKLTQCGSAPRCNAEASVLSWSTDVETKERKYRLLDTTHHTYVVRYKRTDYRQFELNTIPVTTIDL